MYGMKVRSVPWHVTREPSPEISSNPPFNTELHFSNGGLSLERCNCIIQKEKHCIRAGEKVTNAECRNVMTSREFCGHTLNHLLSVELHATCFLIQTSSHFPVV